MLSRDRLCLFSIVSCSICGSLRLAIVSVASGAAAQDCYVHLLAHTTSHGCAGMLTLVNSPSSSHIRHQRCLGPWVQRCALQACRSQLHTQLLMCQLRRSQPSRGFSFRSLVLNLVLCTLRVSRGDVHANWCWHLQADRCDATCVACLILSLFQAEDIPGL